MDLYEIKDLIASAKQLHKSNNYYFQIHSCPVTGGDVKVMMDFKLSTEASDAIIKFGACPHCKDAFFHESFESKR